MLELVVESSSNTGGRFFPCTGFYGVTPVVISGTLTTRVPPLAQPLPVRRLLVSIKCIETRTGGPLSGAEEQVLWEKTKTVWSSEDYVEIGAVSHPFRISIPPDAAKQGTSSTCFKEWKTIWRFDAAIEHQPIPYVGHRITKTYHLNILNHAQPSLVPGPPVKTILGADATTTNVEITPPKGIFGPEDEINVAVQAIPVDPAAVVKKATVVLERVLEYLEEKDSSPGRKSPKGLMDTYTIATSSSDLSAGRCCLDVRIPKRTAKWDSGETFRTKLVSVRFQLRIKLAVRAGKSRMSREVSCEPIPVKLCATTSKERAQAASALAAMPAKVHRKPRNVRRSLYIQQGTVDISSEVIVPRKRSPSPYVPLANLKPILLPPDHQPQSQNISFVFPSPPPHDTVLQPGSLPPINAMFPQASLSPPDFHSWSIIKQFQQTGRRISTTASEEEAMQPSRSRQRLVDEDARPSLPSLDALGLGLPHVTRRPVTAPAHMASPTFNTSNPFRVPEISTFLEPGRLDEMGGRPRTISGPPRMPLDKTLSSTISPGGPIPEEKASNMLSPETFAFNVKGE